MNDSYQAVYDAVRSRISGCNTSDIIERVVREAFDISWQKERLQQEIYAVSYELQRPSAVFRPSVFPDGNMWCALYGANLMEGVCGFGETPEAACADFDNNWRSQKLDRSQSEGAGE